MSAVNKIMWTAVGVGTCGVVVGIGLMMTGDWLGRRDEEALKAAAPSQAVVSPAATRTPANAAPSQIASGGAKMSGGQKMVEALAKLSDGTLFSPPVQEVVARAAEAITVVSDQERLVDRQQIFDATKGNPLPLVFSQSKFVPHLEGARSGLRVASLADSPWAKKAGLEAGDVLTSVNGKPILDPRNMGEIAKDLLSASEVAITVQRAGQDVHLQYHMGSVVQALRNSGNP